VAVEFFTSVHRGSFDMITCDSPEPTPKHRVPLLQVGTRQCRFIVSESVSNAVCCGAPTAELSSWCGWHERIVYTPRLTERERRQAMIEAREVATRTVARIVNKAA
jgi:hypothetical protein